MSTDRPSLKIRRLVRVLLSALLAASSASAGVPGSFVYQGRLSRSGVAVSGPHTFKIRLLAADGQTELWPSGDISVNLPPTGEFSLTLNPAGVDWAGQSPQIEVTVDGEKLSPLEPLASSPYAILAGTATTVLDGAITAAKLAPGAVAADRLADNAVTGAKLADGAVTNAKIAPGLDSAKIQLNSSTSTLDSWQHPTFRNMIDAAKIQGAVTTSPNHASSHLLGGADPLPPSSLDPTQLSGTAVVRSTGINQTIQPPTGAFTAVPLVLKGAEGGPAGTSMFEVWDNRVLTPAEAFSVKGDARALFAGNVGVGTTNPAASLHVSGSALLTGTLSLFDLGGETVSSDGDNLSLGAGAELRLLTSGLRRLTVKTDGNVGVGTTAPGQKLTVAGSVESTSGGFRFPDGSVQTSAAGANSWAAAGPDVYAAGSGNVGVGTSAPLAKLHVRGGAYGGGYAGNAFDRQVIETDDHLRLKLLSPNNRHQVISFGDPENDEAGFVRYRHDADVLDFKVNGAVAMTLLGDGNVGVGLANPNAKLRVAGDAAADRFKDSADFNYFVDPADPAVSAAFSGRVGVGVSSPGEKLTVVDPSGPSIHLRRDGANEWFFAATSAGSDRLGIRAGINADAGEKISVLTSGNVGIGTTGPAYPLHVSRANVSQSGVAMFTDGGVSGGDPNTYLWVRNATAGVDWGLQARTDGGFGLHKAGTGNAFSLDANRNIGIGTDTPGTKLAVVDASGPSIHLRRDGSNEWFFTANPIGADRLGIRTGINTDAGEKLTLLVSGNVGIGVTTPQAKLDISGGNIRISSGGDAKLELFGSNGDRGYVGWGTSPVGVYLWNNDNSALYFGTSNTQRMVIDADGKVGVGTGPSYPLHVSRANVSQPGVAMFTDGGVSGGDPNTYVWIRNATAGVDWGLQARTDGGFGLHRAGSGNALFVDSSRNVGIGTDAPAYKLDVAGDARVNTLTISAATGGAPAANRVYANSFIKAYVTFDGDGGPSVQESFNVSSVTRSSAGVYTVNLATPMSNSSYPVSVTVHGGTGARFALVQGRTASSFSVRLSNASDSANVDDDFISVIVGGGTQ